MELLELLKKHSTQATNNTNDLGIVSEYFKECSVSVTYKNLDKRVSFLFHHEESKLDLRVNASANVNKRYRNGEISLKDMLGMHLYMIDKNANGDMLTDKITGEPITIFSIGDSAAQTVGKVSDLNIPVYEPKAVKLEDLA